MFQTFGVNADNSISAAAVSPEDGLVVEVEAPHHPSLQVNTRRADCAAVSVSLEGEIDAPL